MNTKFLVKKNTFGGDKISYSAVITARDADGNKTATAYMPVNFKKDNMPDSKYESFLIETDNYFISAYSIDGADGKKVGKPKIVICEYTISKDFTDSSYSSASQVDLQPVDEDTLPF